jgi:hypothetical protein
MEYEQSIKWQFFESDNFSKKKTFGQKTFQSNDHFLKKAFGQMNFRLIDLSVKWSFSEKAFGQTTLCAIFFGRLVKRKIGQMNFRSNGIRSNGVRSNGVSVKWPFGRIFLVKWFFGKVIQNQNQTWSSENGFIVLNHP